MIDVNKNVPKRAIAGAIIRLMNTFSNFSSRSETFLSCSIAI